MNTQWTKYLALPAEITPFERRFLTRLNRLALIFFYLHIPVLMAVAWAAGTGPFFALILSLMVVAGPTIAYRAIQNPRSLSVVHGVTAMLMGGLLVHFGQGPVQIEMHFYFFALLAMLCMFANPMVNLSAALTVALHHLIVWWLLPRSVFNYDAQWWVVLVHAAFVVLETVAACYISRQFFDNVIGLEKIVEARTATIRENQRDMQLILNNLDEGLATVDLDGRISGDTSRALQKWFGPPVAGETFAAWTCRRDPAFGEWFDLALASLQEGMLPVDVALGQLPARLKDGERTYSVRYQMIASANNRSDIISSEPGIPQDFGDAALEKILVIVADITEILSKDAAERHQGELLQLFQHMMRDKAGFREFLAESDDIMRSLSGGRHAGLEHVKRLIHTLKGNSAIFGMRRLSEVCQEIENEIAEQGEVPGRVEMAALDQAWEQVRPDIEKLLGETRRGSIEVDPADYAVMLKSLRDGIDGGIAARMMESWRLEPAGKRLARVEDQIRGLAERMGKTNVSVFVEPNNLRFDSDRFAPFWSAFIHVLRNAVDHGVESGEERRKGGKPDQSTIRVATAMEGERFVVIIEDDGPGVDWARLRTKAGKLGIAANAFAEPVKLLCLPGVSSRETITELSGRGMGMSAIAEACESLGGTISVKSQRGVGTRIEFAFARNYAVYDGYAASLRSGMTQVGA
jgi:HPt (histidine-containing phosphotransfer) domain-containing protein/two-component sensor histidine kinase